jgi:hypothetical protein
MSISVNDRRGLVNLTPVTFNLNDDRMAYT